MNKIFYNKRGNLSAVKMYYMMVYLSFKYKYGYYEKYPFLDLEINNILDANDQLKIISMASKDILKESI